MAELKTDQELRQMAERRANAKLGFRIHATVFALVNAGLTVVNLLTSPQVWWSLWPLFGWGIGLAAHAWTVYGGMGQGREDAIAKELPHLRERYGDAPPKERQTGTWQRERCAPGSGSFRRRSGRMRLHLWRLDAR